MLAIADGATDDAQVGMYTLVVTASDTTSPTPLTAVHTATLTVENVNDAPVVEGTPPAMLTTMEGLAANWDVSAWFSDEDTGDVLTYKGRLANGGNLPIWLELNYTTGALTIEAGATNDAEVGIYTLAVTAQDRAGAMVVHTTTLTILDDITEPIVKKAFLNRIAPAAGTSLVLDLKNSSLILIGRAQKLSRTG